MGQSTRDFLNPDALMKPAGYSHIAKVTSGAIVYIAGQVATDASGQLVGEGDLEAQAEQVFRNLESALEAAGGTMSDLVKINVFLVEQLQTDAVAKIRAVRNRHVNVDKPPTSTLVVVSRLARPDWLLEIEAVAAIGS